MIAITPWWPSVTNRVFSYVLAALTENKTIYRHGMSHKEVIEHNLGTLLCSAVRKPACQTARVTNIEQGVAFLIPPTTPRSPKNLNGLIAQDVLLY